MSYSYINEEIGLDRITYGLYIVGGKVKCVDKYASW